MRGVGVGYLYVVWLGVWNSRVYGFFVFVFLGLRGREVRVFFGGEIRGDLRLGERRLGEVGVIYVSKISNSGV